MGGGTFGNRSPVAEFNIWADPEAAAVVFGYGGPLVMAGLDLTHQLLATPDAHRRRAPPARAAWRPRSPTCSRSSPRPTSAATTASPAPPCTTRAPCSPSPTPTCSSAERRHVAVETAGALTRGMTVIDRRTLKERPPPNCDVLTRDRRRRRLRRHRRRHRVRSPDRRDGTAGSEYGSPRDERRLPAPRTVSAEGTDSYPRQSARTQRFTLGEPRDVVVSPDGQRIVFLRSRGGTDPVNCLWVVDAATGEERLVADPEVLLGGRDDEACRPRSGRAASGPASRPAGSRPSPPTPPSRSPRSPSAGGCSSAGCSAARRASSPSPARCSIPGPTRWPQRVAYVSGRLLCIGELDGRWRVLAGGDADEPETVTWGSADFIAAEEMDRFRGYWWSPDGTALAVTPGRHGAGAALAPRRPRRSRRSTDASCRTRPPAPPTPTSRCTSSASTARSSTSSGTATRFPYLADVQLERRRADRSTVQRRDQRSLDVLRVDPATGATELLARGPRRRVGRARARRAAARAPTARSSRAPTATAPGACSSTASRSRRPTCRCAPWRPSTGRASCSPPTRIDDATSIHVWRWSPTASWRRSPTSPACTPSPPAAAPSSCARRRSPSPARSGRRSTASSWRRVAATPSMRADVTLSFAGERRIATAVLLPQRPRRLAAAGAARPLRRPARAARRAAPTTPT